MGPFIGCTDYPECKHTQQIGDTAEESEAAAKSAEYPKVLGQNEAGLDVSVRKGRMAFMFNWVKLKGRGKIKPSPSEPLSPKGMDPEQVTLEKALDMLALLRDLASILGNG